MGLQARNVRAAQPHRKQPAPRFRTTARLQHPHILPLFDSGEADGLLYYVMPYVEGNYAVSPDGRSFYFVRTLPGTPSQLVVVLNWFEELRRLTGE